MPATGTPPPQEGVLGCEQPTPTPAPYPLPDPPPETGFFSCAAGFTHREAARECPPPLGIADANAVACESDCSDVRNGVCDPGSFCKVARCVSGCATDDDCPSDELCFCDYQVNHCVKASCRVDADCGPGLLCIATSSDINGLSPFTCQTPDDECTTKCTGYSAHPYGTCNLTQHTDGTHSRGCAYSDNTGGSCGRPFLVAGGERLARADANGGWVDARQPAPNLAGLDARLRLALAARWRGAGLMEHASIAAFARFTLELLALGAPPSLIADATAAMADEQRHAATCFALASAYAGSPFGPGPLDVRGCLATVELESVVVTAFLEGCIGETIAAVEARETARRVSDPVLERVLSQIGSDESRHAALAWRFVHWALATSEDGAGLVARLRLELSRAIAAASADSCTTPATGAEEDALRHGLAPDAFRASLRQAAIADIVLPCLEALAALPSTQQTAA